MRKGLRLTIVLVAMVCMFAMFATSAYAYTNYWVRCQNCHMSATAATVTPVAGANDGTTAAYTFTASAGTEWAVFAGASKLASGAGSSGSFSVPAGADYELYVVSGTPSAGTFAKAIVSPTATFPDAAGDVTPPVSTAVVAASYNNAATIEITATDDQSGVAYIYYTLNGGSTKVTPIGVGGKAIVYVQPTTAGTSTWTLEYWAQDRAGNDEDPAKSATFDIVRAAAATGSSATPSVIGVNGRSKWTYADLADTFEKYEGGYVAYGAGSGWYANPHGGYDTATNKCKVCHAVHRAEGAYYLLRADSQDDACDYCHVGGSAHSSLVVYDSVTDPTAATNGHTIGASTYIPDSTVAQWTETVTLETVDANMDPLTEDIHVRAYDEQKNDMYRFARHHGHSEATGAARRNYLPVGPLALRCMSCHQVHNASAQTWQSVGMANIGTAGEYLAASHVAGQPVKSAYKLLKQFPSGTFVGGTDSYGQIGIGQISIVPETTLTAGVNFDNVRAMGADPTALNLVRGATSRAYKKPMWVAQGFDGEHDPAEYLAEEAIASAVNNAALSVWCADCHNLNIGGWEHLANEELGFKSHTERTHPAPYTGAHSGPGQCYSCHRADLPKINTGDSCSQCHYGTGNYKENRTAGAEYVASDFPHAGDNSYKLLGNYSIVPIATYGQSATTINNAVTITADNLDAVCIRCHGGIGTYH